MRKGVITIGITLFVFNIGFCQLASDAPVQKNNVPAVTNNGTTNILASDLALKAKKDSTKTVNLIKEVLPSEAESPKKQLKSKSN
jgi:hypothetical protein